MRNTRTWLLAASLGAIFSSCESSPAPAWAEYNPNLEETYVQIVLTEAAGEGMSGMQAVAEVIRNRQWSTKGFAGIKRKNLSSFIKSQSHPCYLDAQRAVLLAKRGSNLVQGATHFENIEAFGEPWWAKKMKVVAKLGLHTFYRESR